MEELHQKKEGWLLIFAFLFGIACDYLFYGKSVGVSVPIAVMVFYILFIWKLKNKIDFSFSFAWVLILPIFLLTITYVLYSNSVFNVLNGIAIPILIAAQTMLIQRYEQTGEIDLQYLSRLSYDVVPALVKLSQQTNKPEDIEDTLQGIKVKLNQSEPWQSFNISKYKAIKRLDHHE